MEAEEAQWCQNHQRPITHKCDACDFTGCIVCAAVHEIRLGPPHQMVSIITSNNFFALLISSVKKRIKRHSL